jgi:transcriptional regulator with XRE-family HTH domain
MSNIEKKIGAKITEIRKSKQLTQNDLAILVGVSLETISRMERGVSFPSLKTIEKISSALGVYLKDFFDIDSHRPKSKVYERELSKLVATLRTLTETEIRLVHKILKQVISTIKASK